MVTTERIREIIKEQVKAAEQCGRLFIALELLKLLDRIDAEVRKTA